MAIWYGENRSGRTERWRVGDIVRYDTGPTALMKVSLVRERGRDQRGIACEVQYYGQEFFDAVTCRYHGQCTEPTEADLAEWEACHKEDGTWNGRYSSAERQC